MRIVSIGRHSSLFEALGLPVEYDRTAMLRSNISWLLRHRSDARQVAHIHVEVIICASCGNWILDETH